MPGESDSNSQKKKKLTFGEDGEEQRMRRDVARINENEVGMHQAINYLAHLAARTRSTAIISVAYHREITSLQNLWAKISLYQSEELAYPLRSPTAAEKAWDEIQLGSS